MLRNVAPALWFVLLCGLTLGCDSAESDDDGAASEDGGDGDGDGDGDSDGSVGCQTGNLTPGDQTIQIDHDGESRSATLHVPPGYEPGTPTPLVFNFHGYGSNAPQQRFFSAMDELADEQGFLLVYPQGLVNESDDRASWNAGTCCAFGDETRDDVGFTRALAEEIGARACVDPSRVFATGMSNGGYMSYRLACEAGDLFAAVAPVSGQLGLTPAQCAPSRPVPMWQVNGTADPLVDFDSARAGFETWLGLAGCESAGEAGTPEGSVSCETFTCDGGAEATFCAADGMGHCWPGQEFCIDGESTLDVSANEAMWAFFERHPMP